MKMLRGLMVAAVLAAAACLGGVGASAGQQESPGITSTGQQESPGAKSGSSTTDLSTQVVAYLITYAP